MPNTPSLYASQPMHADGEMHDLALKAIQKCASAIECLCDAMKASVPVVALQMASEDIAAADAAMTELRARFVARSVGRVIPETEGV